MNDGSQGSIYCLQCPDIYARTEISADREGEKTTLAELMGEVPPKPAPAEVSVRKRLRHVGRLIQGIEEPRSGGPADLPDVKRQLADGLRRLGAWEFTCPRGHAVDGNRGEQLLLAVVGPSGASKSHFLPGMLWETSAMLALEHFGVSLREGAFTDLGLKGTTESLYRAKRPVPRTPPDAVLGPFGYRLGIGAGREQSRYSLLLCDVGGEALESIARIRQQAPFVLLAKAFFMLIDPQDLLPSEFHPTNVPSPTEQVAAAATARDSINRVADAIEELWGDQPISDLAIPSVMVLPKADSIIWTFDYRGELSAVVEGVRQGTSLRDCLIESSNRVRSAFMEAGGRTVIGGVESRFNLEAVRWTATSATNEMPELDGEGEVVGWSNPVPCGQSLALLHALDLLDLKISFDGSAN